MLTVDQIKLFLEAVKDHRFYPIYLIAIGCGLREGEILALEARDISLERKVLQVRRTVVQIGGKLSFGEPKSNKSKRSVAIPDFVIDALKDRIPQEGLIFKVSNGGPISPRNLLRHFQDNLEKLGMPRVHFHSLRHSYASL